MLSEIDKETLRVFKESVETYDELVMFLFFAFKDITSRLLDLEEKLGIDTDERE